MSSLFPTSPPPSASGSDNLAGVAAHYVRIAVERGVDTGRGDASSAGLTYASPTPLEVGRRVEVPLGRGDSMTAGIVIAAGGPELLGDFPAHRVKPISRDTGTGLTPDLVELARWMSSYYVCPLGMVLAAMLPAAVKHRTGLRTLRLIARVDAAREAELAAELKLPPQTRDAWNRIAAIERDAFPLSHDELAARIQSRTLGPVNRLVKLGLLAESSVDDVRATGGVPTDRGVETAGYLGQLPGLPTLTPEQSRVVDGIAGVLDAFHVHLLHGITGAGKTEVYLRVLQRVLEEGRSAIVLVPEISLTPQTAGRFVERFRGVGVAVLHSGLSNSQRHKEWARAGSGAARVVVGARSAIFAPLENIGLVVVDEEHAGDYKQDQLPRYHGRDVAIKRAQMSGCPIILGSATPSLESWVNATGIDPNRDRQGATRLPPALDQTLDRDETGTSPPPPEPARSLTVAVPTSPAPKYTLWQLKSRIGHAVLPKVEIVDLAEERKLRRHLTRTQNAHLHLLGPTLERAIADTLEEDAAGQVLLLLNRRGYSSYIACPVATCGWVMVCDDCDAKMVQHRVIAGSHPRKGVVRCHHCLAQKLLPEACPLCTARTIALGLGTQRIEQELAQKFAHLLGGDPRTAGTVPAIDIGLASEPSPEAWILPPAMARVDGDTMGSAKDYFDTLSRFAAGELRLLVGTQMIAKGLDFPNVRLVGVINADSALSLPDFRAAERTFQLVAQVAGRAGRGGLPGRVVVQTMDPSAPSIVHAANHDFETFAAEELLTRRQAGLPPASRMARIVCRDEDFTKATDHAQKIAAALREALSRRDEAVARTTSIIGPAPCPVSRIGGFHRQELLITSPARLVIQSLLAELRTQGLLVSDAHTAIDIDPIALM